MLHLNFDLKPSAPALCSEGVRKVSAARRLESERFELWGLKVLTARVLDPKDVAATPCFLFALCLSASYESSIHSAFSTSMLRVGCPMRR